LFVVIVIVVGVVVSSKMMIARCSTRFVFGQSFPKNNNRLVSRSLALSFLLMPVAFTVSNCSVATENEVRDKASKNNNNHNSRSTTTTTTTATTQKQINDNENNKGNNSYSSSKQKQEGFWKSAEGSQFIKEVLSNTQGEKPSIGTLTESAKNKLLNVKDKIIAPLIQSKNVSDYLDLTKSFSSLLSGNDKKDALDSIVSQVQSTAEQGSGGITDTSGFSSILSVMQEHTEKIQTILDNEFGHIDFSYFTPAALWYYLEREDERKNPSWKRLQHRYHKTIDITMVEDLNKSLNLAQLAYCDSSEELKKGLKANAAMPLELLYYQMESKPSQPSHFVAVKRGQSWWSNALEVVIVVRGTKTISDALTDAVMEAVDYRDGKAHAGIVESGKWLAREHADLFEQLKANSDKKKIKLTLIGHSLGAGAAAIAGMELKDQKDMDVNVVGFGCPALVSENLSKASEDYITTVICDSDVVPRLSGATIANAALEIMEYDRYPKLLRDIQLAVDALGEYSPQIATEDRKKQAMEYIESLSEDIKTKLLKPKTKDRVAPVLFPPGKCVHLYRDGHSTSGSISPCTFFGEIDVTRTMVDDHLIPTGYGKMFLDIMRRYYDDEHFTFDGYDDGKK